MQELVVAAIVAFAAWTVARRYLPAAVKKRAAASLAALFARLGWQRAAARFAQSAEKAGCGNGCGSCGGCGGCGSTDQAQTPADFAITPENLRRTVRR